MLFIGVSAVSGFQIEGLEFADVDAEFHEDNVTLSGDYVETNLTPRQLFVPDELDPHLLDDFTYSLQGFDQEQWPETEAQLFLQVLYPHYTNEPYPSNELNATLGGKEDVGNWTGHQYGFDASTQVNRSEGQTNIVHTGLTSMESVQGEEKERTRFQIDVSTHYALLIPLAFCGFDR